MRVRPDWSGSPVRAELRCPVVHASTGHRCRDRHGPVTDCPQLTDSCTWLRSYPQPVREPGDPLSAPVVVLDTNVFVAAGFRPSSASGRILEAVRAGRIRMVWTDATRRETEAVVSRIPPLEPGRLLDVFADADRREEGDESRYGHVPDPADRKFAALAGGTDAILVTSDAPLLGAAAGGGFEAVTPSVFARRLDMS